MTYTVFAHIPYEGQHNCFTGGIEALEAWFREGHGGYHLDDLEIYSNDAPDVYELASRMKDDFT